MKQLDYYSVHSCLVDQLSEFLGNKKAIIGISGGIDSAVVASLCVRAIGKDNVIGVQMPYGDQSIDDSEKLIKSLGIHECLINIKSAVDISLGNLSSNGFKPISRLTNGNRRARERMATLYALAGELNGLVIGTGNKTELLLGYFTKYGDGGCDIEPIGGLYKTEVFGLAKYLGDIPESIINKAPSAELWEGQTDEGEIGMSYAEMDDILNGLKTCDIGRYLQNRYALESKYGVNKVSTIARKVIESEHKRKMPRTILID